MNTRTGEDQAGVREVPAQAIPPDTFGNRIMLARHMYGLATIGRSLSIREAADLCGIGRGAWTNWERGARPIDMLDHVEVISEKLRVDRVWLRDGGPLARPATRRGRRGRSEPKVTYSQIGGFPGRGKPFGPAPDATRSSGPGSRPPDHRPAGHPTMFERQAIRDLGWAA